MPSLRVAIIYIQYEIDKLMIPTIKHTGAITVADVETEIKGTVSNNGRDVEVIIGVDK